MKAHDSLHPRGGGTKPALSTPRPGATVLDLSGLTSIIEYNPGEFTFTALAGARIAEIETLLRQSGQHLPFDPPLGAAGATLGGSVAAGLSGPGRNRYGGVRDFILGIRFIDGRGELLCAGGKVVKNAAGFDLPKLMVGSLGCFGVLAEISFKVFPAPKAQTTLKVTFPGLDEALSAMVKLNTSSFDLEALDLEPPGTLWIRIGGEADALSARIATLEQFLCVKGETFHGDEETNMWRGIRDFSWASDSQAVAKIPLIPRSIASLEKELANSGASRRYSAAGNLGWIAWPDDSAGKLSPLLASLGLPGLFLKGPNGNPFLGTYAPTSLTKRIKAVLDPEGRFPTF